MKIGVIGLGHRATAILLMMLKYERKNGMVLAAIHDILSPDELIAAQPALTNDIKKAKFYSTALDMLENEGLDGVIVGTRCSSHTAMALEVIRAGIPLFMEKPVCTTMADWQALYDVYASHNDKTVISFPLRFSPMVQQVKKIIDTGTIGKVEHVWAYNFVNYGSVYYHNWYRDESITGGLFLQKATHDFDCIQSVLGDSYIPQQVAAMGSKQVFKGDRPVGLICEECPDFRTCPESPYILETFKNEYVQGHECSFAVDTGNHDSASALIRYNTGMHVNYTQNFFIRKHAAKRGALFAGYDGTVEFDFYTNEIKLYPHNIDRVDIYRYDNSKTAHFGGDELLVLNFIEVMQGKPSISTLQSGLLSALVCLKATESEKNGKFIDILSMMSP